MHLGHHSLIDSSWLHNHFTTKSAATAYERACGRFYRGKMAMFGEAVMGFLRASQKGLPQWTRGVWLRETISNDSHIIGTPNRIFLHAASGDCQLLLIWSCLERSQLHPGIMDAPVWGTDLSMQNVLFHPLQLRMTAVFVCQTRMQKMFEILPKHTLLSIQLRPCSSWPT